MTLHIADIASYQGSLALDQLAAAGFGGINVKISHGLTAHSVHPRAGDYVQDARARGWALSGFHWLTGDAPGERQADFAFGRMITLGLDRDAAFVVDVEATTKSVGGIPTEQHWTDFRGRMTVLLGRPFAVYSGAWWARSRPWLAPTAEAPWLWSAPASGYLPAYPGDEALAWDNAYNGWDALAVMQYRVAQVAGIPVSQSAARSPRLWQMMTGGTEMAWVNIPASMSLIGELNAAFPNRDRSSDGTVGDTSHAAASSDHNPDETGNAPGSDTDIIDEVHARDIDADLRAAGWTMREVCNIVVARHRAGTDVRLQNIIYDRHIISRSWSWSEWRPYSGKNAHTQHAHFGFRYGSGSAPGNPEQITSPWGILAAVQQEDIVEQADIDKIVNAVTAKLKPGIDAASKGRVVGNKAYPARTDLVILNDLSALLDDWVGDAKGAATRPPKAGALGDVLRKTPAQNAAILTAVQALAARVDVDEVALAAALAEPLATALAPLLPEDKEVDAETLSEAFRALLTQAP